MWPSSASRVFEGLHNTLPATSAPLTFEPGVNAGASHRAPARRARSRDVGGRLVEEPRRVNAWAGLTVDPARHLVFAGLGSATFDFYGVDRRGDNLFANSPLALDSRHRPAASGTFRRFVTTSGTGTCPPRPCWRRVTHDGRRIDAAAQITKTGFVYCSTAPVVDRCSPLKSGPCRQSDIPGERLRHPAGSGEAAPLLPAIAAGRGSRRLSPEAAAKLRYDFGAFRAASCSPTTEAGSCPVPRLHRRWQLVRRARSTPTTGCART